MSAVNINLDGYVTFNSLQTPGATTIDGGNIKTGTITADRISSEIGQVKSLLYIGNPNDHYTAKEIRFSSNACILSEGDVFGQTLNLSANILELIDPGYIYIGNASSVVTCKGTWNFSNADVTGLTAVFG